MNIFKKSLFTKYFLSIALLAIPVGFALAGSPVPNTFQPGTTISSGSVNSNFSDLASRSWDKSGNDLYYSGGNVGIGTTGHGGLLDVNSGTALTGTVDINGTTAVSGTGTNFSTALSVGSFIVIDGESRKVTAITDDTNLTVNSAFTNTKTGEDIAKVAMVVQNGFVGIGATAPSAGLVVETAAPPIAILNNTGADWVTMNFARRGSNKNSLGLAPESQAYIASDAFVVGSYDGANWTDPLIIENGAATGAIYINTNGDVGIGTTSPSYKLHVNGTAATISWTNLSSREYKENIRKVNKNRHAEMLERLLKMDITTYNYKKEFGGDGETKLGFLAEEMPREVLSKDGKGVDVYELLAFSIGAIKAQQDEIKALRAQIRSSNKLEERLGKLEAQMNK